MAQSLVYRHLNFLTSLRDVGQRRQLLMNMTSFQTKALCEIAKRIADGTITILRRDAESFARKRLVLRTLASKRVGVSRKKETLKKNSSLIPLLVRERYIIGSIIDEIRRTRRASEQ